MKNKKQNGFTLIELLVIIAIIGLLSSVVLASLNSARAKARDARRKADLHQIQIAIEFFISDNNRGIFAAGWWAEINNQCVAWGQIYNQISPKYISKVPEDPLNPGPPPQCVGADGYWYYYGQGFKFNGSTLSFSGDPMDYSLCSKLENSSDKDYKTIANPWGGGWTLNYCIGN